nr:hypothetical protein [Alistipes sp.]
MFSKKTIIFVSRNLTPNKMNFTVRRTENYQAPAIEVVECKVERGFDVSGGGETGLPDFDNENEM